MPRYATPTAVRTSSWQGRISLRKERVPLGKLFAEPSRAHSRLSWDAVSHSRPLSLRSRYSLTPIQQDLSRYFVNLLTNAGKYTDSGGRIRLSTQRARATVTVPVTMA